MKSKNTGFLDIAIPTAFTTLFVALALGVIGSWLGNIWRIFKCDFEPSYKAEIVRILGVFIPPVGIIACWMDIGPAGE